MKQSVVYSAIFGGYDKLSDKQYVIPDTDYLCFTDKGVESKTWKIIKGQQLSSTKILNLNL
jgi:hypothetical protein